MTYQPELFNIPSPDKSYEAILADPPWKFAAGGTKATTNQYDCMKLHQIAALPVHKIAAQDSLLFMWATAPMLPHALEVVRAWNFEYISCAAWAKQSKLGNGWDCWGNQTDKFAEDKK